MSDIPTEQLMLLSVSGNANPTLVPLPPYPVMPVIPEPLPPPPFPDLYYHDVRAMGARGDNSTDDTFAIQSAIDAACQDVPTLGGGIVLFPPGIYKVSGPLFVWQDNVALIGYMPIADTYDIGSGTLISPTAAFPSDSYVIKVCPVDARKRPLCNIRISKIGISPFGVSLRPSVNGLYLSGYRAFIQDVFIQEMSGNACVIEGQLGNSGDGWNTYETKFQNCHFRACRGHGLVMLQNTADMHFLDCVFHGNKLDGLHQIGGASNHFVSCHFTGNRSNIRINGTGSRSKWIGCKLEACDEHNVWLDATNGGGSVLHFIGCNFNATTRLTKDNTFDHIYIGRDSGGNTVSGVIAGCSFHQAKYDLNAPRYHINLTAAASRWVISGCSFDNRAKSGKINHSSQAKLCLINGLGLNAGDPAVEGQWLGNGEEGIRIYNTLANTFHTLIGGAWRNG